MVSNILPPEAWFLDVGQGDSELMLLPKSSGGYVSVLIDAGPDNKVAYSLEKAFKDKYIDMLVLTHPHIDHYGGMTDIISRYCVGIIVLPAGSSDTASYKELLSAIKNKGIKNVVLSEGDSISYSGSKFSVLWPPKATDVAKASKLPNDFSLTMFANIGGMKVMLPADIGIKQEKEIAQKNDISADILKVAHHGSKGSSSMEFISEVSPKFSFIEVGDKNTYGFPKPETLSSLANIKSAVFRTDKDATLGVALYPAGFSILRPR